MPKLSAGILLHRIREGSVLEVLIVHPGGPFWAKKDDGAWSIPKGEYLEGEDPHATAYREFEEEIGKPPPTGDEHFLGEIRQPSGKRLSVWALSGDLDPRGFTSNEFEMEWPRGSGKMGTFPEVDRVEWFPVAAARIKLLKGHVPFLDRVVDHVRDTQPDVAEGATPPTQDSLF